ncbi:MAG: RluA family pseudouridine synthase [Sandaracinaceae bacterium]
MILRVLFDEDSVVVVNKPAGLESTGRTPDDPGGAQHHLQRQLGRRLWLVHQLDRHTSGLLVFVRKRSLVAPMSERTRVANGADKRYLAIVRGHVTAPQRVKAPLAYDRSSRRWVVRDGGKPALTVFSPRAEGDDVTLLEAELRTGRTHQIRVHAAHLGHPLLGERRYADCRRAPRQALHAWRLRLSDGLRFEAPVPEDLRVVAAKVGLALP